MTFREMYTALSRATKLDDIYLDEYTEKYFSNHDEDNYKYSIMTSRDTEGEQLHGKIYKIEINDEPVYIGSTRKKFLTTRLQ